MPGASQAADPYRRATLTLRLLPTTLRVAYAPRQARERLPVTATGGISGTGGIRTHTHEVLSFAAMPKVCVPCQEEERARESLRRQPAKTPRAQSVVTPPAKIMGAEQEGCGDRNRTCDRAVNSRLPVPARAPPQQCRAMTRGNSRESERPAGIEPALSPWQGDRQPLHHGRKVGAANERCRWLGYAQIARLFRSGIGGI
jgi:hypothetical protein